MAIFIRCPNAACLAGASVADTLSGRTVKCKRCGTPFLARPTADGSQSDTRPVTVPAEDPFPALPATFGRYRVLKVLGKGGMGAVYLAEDTELGRKVALKLPSFGPSAPPTRVERFLREARAAAALHHPNICTIFDVGREGGRPYLTMAYIEGRPLADAIDSDKPMPERQAAGLARQIALALAHAHERGVVHRDLKPANVMLTAASDPVVMDFGLAKRLAEEDTAEAKLTREGAVIGTPSYMAPEQVRGESAAIGPRTDVYALGALLFELLTGRTPFEGPVGVVLANVLTGKVPAVRDVRRDADQRLDAACRKAMAKEPADRFPTMAAFADALAECVNVPAARPALPPTVIEARSGPPPLPTTVTKEAKTPLTDLGDKPARPRPARRRAPRPIRWGLWAGIGAMVLAAAVVVVVLLTVRTRYGEVVIELSDPAAKVEVKVDGERIELVGLDRPISLKAGEHGLTVTGPDFETVTRSFSVKRGEREVVKVTLAPAAKRGGVAPRTDPVVPAVEPLSEPETAARDKAIAWLKKEQTDWGGGLGDWEAVRADVTLPTGGPTALALLALLESGVPLDDPVVARGMKYFRNSQVEPKNVYVVALQTQVYCTANQPEDADRIKANVRWLENAAAYDNGKLLGWSYTDKPAGRADTSCTRYAVAALHAANRAGYLPTKLGLWADVRELFVRTQVSGGGWRYCETDEKAKDKPPTHTMTACGALCLVLATQAMPPADPEANPVVAAGLDWLARNFRLDGTSEYYNLDVLAALGRARGMKLLGSGAPARDWFREGSEWLLKAQKFDGRFVGTDLAEKNPIVATAFALRFLASRPAGSRAAAAPADGFVPLFNGKDLTGWTVMTTSGTDDDVHAAAVDDSGWKVQAGEIRCTSSENGWLRSDREYGDFELQLEFKLRPDGNSGIYVRCPGTGHLSRTGMEIQILDDAANPELRPQGRTGAIHGVVGPSSSVLRPAGEWNSMEIRCEGKAVRVTVNGTRAVDAAMNDYPSLRTRPRSGFVGLTNWHGLAKGTAFRNVRIRPLGEPPAAKAPLAQPELIKLSELPPNQNKSGPWLSADGRSLYWADKNRAEHWIWRADRPGPGRPFGDAVRLFSGHDMTLSADMTEVILVDHDPAAGEKKFALFAGKKARPTDVVFGSWRRLNELARFGFVAAPCLTADGLTLYAEQFGDSYLPPNIRFHRADRSGAWGRAEAVPISGLEKGSLRFPYVSPDGRYLFGNNDVSPSGMVMLTSTDGGKTFGSPRAVRIPGGSMKGKFPRYVPDLNEFFFGEVTSDRTAELYVIRNFDPDRDTRPVK